ncbi:hypothetical protein ACFX2J_017897 [Malus domestica]
MEEAPLSGFRRGTTFYTQHQLLGYHRLLCQRSLTKFRHINFEDPATLLLPTRVKEQHHCLITRKSQCVSTSVLRGKANWQKCLTFTHIRENTPNRITFSKIEETLASESQESDSQQDCFLKKSKRHRSLNLESQILDMIACSKIEEAPLFELREPDFLG